MPKMKSRKGLLKRIKITGTGKVKFKRPGKSHLNSHMTGASIRAKRRDGVAKKGDIRKLERILHRRLKPAD